MSATLASLLQTGRGALWLTAQDLAPRNPPSPRRAVMPPVSAKDWEGPGPRRPAHSWESLSGKGTGASSTPQRRREAPGTPRLGRRPTSRAMASFSFFLQKVPVTPTAAETKTGPRRQACSRPGVQACRVAAATARTPQRLTGCPGSPPRQPRRNF